MVPADIGPSPDLAWKERKGKGITYASFPSHGSGLGGLPRLGPSSRRGGMRLPLEAKES